MANLTEREMIEKVHFTSLLKCSIIYECKPHEQGYETSSAGDRTSIGETG